MKRVLVVAGVLLSVGYLAALGVGIFQTWGSYRSGCGPDCQVTMPSLRLRSGQSDSRIAVLTPLLQQAQAQALGISVEDLQAARRTGTSMAGLAAEHGKTVDEVRQTFLRASQALLDQAVSAGNLSQSQADRLMKRLQAVPGFGFGPPAAPPLSRDGRNWPPRPGTERWPGRR